MFYVKNISGMQRVLRLALAGAGAAFMLVGFWDGMPGQGEGGLAGVLPWLMGAVVLSLAVSGIIGFCPMCAMLGLRQRRDTP